MRVDLEKKFEIMEEKQRLTKVIVLKHGSYIDTQAEQLKEMEASIVGFKAGFDRQHDAIEALESKLDSLKQNLELSDRARGEQLVLIKAVLKKFLFIMKDEMTELEKHNVAIKLSRLYVDVDEKQLGSSGNRLEVSGGRGMPEKNNGSRTSKPTIDELAAWKCPKCKGFVARETICPKCGYNKEQEQSEYTLKGNPEFIEVNDHIRILKENKIVLRAKFVADLKDKWKYLTIHMYEMRLHPDFEKETERVFNELIEKYSKEGDGNGG
jgi:ribosomal protein L32